MRHNYRIPNLFVLGAPKCGTTSIINYLKQHPDIFVSPVKEPHYFNTDSGHRYYFSKSDYLRLFEGARQEHRYRCEGSVWYLYSEVAVRGILNFNPDARFVVMLRDPVSMFFSLHRELLFGGSEDNPSALESWQLQEQRAQGRSLPYGCAEPALLQYGRVCSLGQQVERLLATVPRSRIQFILLDELRLDAEGVYLRLQEFLDIPPHRLSSYSVANKAKARRSYALSRVVIWFAEQKKRLGFSRSIGIADAINRRNVIHGVPIDTAEIEALAPTLYEYFRSDIELLELHIGKDLSAWKSL